MSNIENKPVSNEVELNEAGCMSAEDIYAVFQNCSEDTMNELSSKGLHEGMTQNELLQLIESCNDVVYQEMVEAGVFGPVITFEQLITLSSGVDEANLPNAFAALQIDTITPELEALPYANIAFGAPVLNIYAAGGCVVVTADFARDNVFEYRRATQIIDEWMKGQGTDEYKDKFLTLGVSPVILNGEVMILFHELVFAQGIAIENNTYRLIMAFDGNQTQNIINTDVSLELVKSEIDAELARREAEARAAASEVVDDNNEDEVSPANPYEQAVDRAYDVSYLSDKMDDDADGEEYFDEDEDDSGSYFGGEDIEEESEPWMRISKDDKKN